MSARILRGNFEPKRAPDVDVATNDDLTSRFEAEALRRLGGSIAFVSKKKFTLGLEQTSASVDQRGKRDQPPTSR